MSWIDTSEQLPEVKENGFSEYVLVSQGGFAMRTARIGRGVWRSTVGFQINNVRYWMPLPPLPIQDTGDSE